MSAADMGDKTNQQQHQQVLHLPLVQLIGAQKAGTSAVADWLFDEGGIRRPRVFDDEPSYYSKEVHFFDDDWRYSRGVEFYSKRFHHDDDDDFLTMDACPDTLAFADRVRSTYETAGQADRVKIIVILREPVSRELSLYNHLAYDFRRLPGSERTEWHRQVIGSDGSILSFDDFVRERSLPALSGQNGLGMSTRHGKYAVHLRKWFARFDRQQILVLSYSELKYHPERIQERIATFLQLNIKGRLKIANSNENPHKVKHVSVAARSALNSVFAPLNNELYEILDSSPGPPMEQKPFIKFCESPHASHLNIDCQRTDDGCMSIGMNR